VLFAQKLGAAADEEVKTEAQASVAGLSHVKMRGSKPEDKK
jgi:hypothetical protein